MQRAWPTPPVRARADRAGRVPTWIPLACAAAFLVWVFDGLSQGVSAAGLERIDPRSSRMSCAEGYCDPRWDDLLRRALATLPTTSIHDEAAIARIRATVASLPFVAAVGEACVIWPDSLDVPVRLRTPAACVQQGPEFVAISEDGVVLPGRWPTPPWIVIPGKGEGYLPVIGPNDGAFERARPGERLKEPRHLDALAVAISMRAGLTREEFRSLGPPLVDATEARLDPLAHPGVVVRLEGRRAIVFGRAPNASAIGERPAERKWADVRKAAAFLQGLHTEPPAPSARDWAFLDVRWDTPDITWRDAATSDEADPRPQPTHKRP